MKILIFVFLFRQLYCLDSSDNHTTIGEFLVRKGDISSLAELETQCLRKTYTHAKDKATPEPTLPGQCKPYRKIACCTLFAADRIHQTYMYQNFNTTCKESIKLSDNCRKHFESQLCFHECSPDIGPWILQNSPDRFAGVPLCKQDCDAWYEACKNDNGCFLGWNFGRGDAHLWQECSKDNCLKFKQVYSSAVELCEQVWDHSWKVVNDTEHCMTVDYEPENEHNSYVTRHELIHLGQEIFATSSGKISVLDMLIILGTAFIIFVAIVFVYTVAHFYFEEDVVPKRNEEVVSDPESTTYLDSEVADTRL